MKSILYFVFATVALTFLATSQGLECFSCNEASDDHDCGDGYGKNGSHVQNCDNAVRCVDADGNFPEIPKYACRKSKVWLANRLNFVTRLCVEICDNTETDTCKLTVIDEGKQKWETCTCFGPKCNGAKALTFTLTLILVPLLALFSLF